MTSATVTPIGTRARARRGNPNRPPAIARERMSLTQIYIAGVAAGAEPTGVYAVYCEGRKPGSVIDAEGHYIGTEAVTTRWPMRNGSASLDTELLPEQIYAEFKAALGALALEQALARVHALGCDSTA